MFFASDLSLSLSLLLLNTRGRPEIALGLIYQGYHRQYSTKQASSNVFFPEQWAIMGSSSEGHLRHSPQDSHPGLIWLECPLNCDPTDTVSIRGHAGACFPTRFMARFSRSHRSRVDAFSS